jgi:hypothetical protein
MSRQAGIARDPGRAEGIAMPELHLQHPDISLRCEQCVQRIPQMALDMAELRRIWSQK